MTRAGLRIAWSGLLIATLAIASTPVSLAAGNSEHAKLCQHNGWGDWNRTDGTSFRNQGDCVSYAAQGGTLAEFTVSTSSHLTATRVDLEQIHLFQTQVIGVTDGGPAYDQTVDAAASSSEVTNAFETAEAAIRARLVEGGGQGQIVISGPSLLSATDTTETAFIGRQPDRVEVTVTTTTTPGPADTVVINTNTHTETFVNDVFQTTVRHSSVYLLTGTIA